MHNEDVWADLIQRVLLKGDRQRSIMRERWVGTHEKNKDQNQIGSHCTFLVSMIVGSRLSLAGYSIESMSARSEFV